MIVLPQPEVPPSFWDALQKAQSDIENETGVLSGVLNRAKASLMEVPPIQQPLFTFPPPGVWVYKIEFRAWRKYSDGREDWSEWTPLLRSSILKAWYSRRGDAERALRRWIERHNYWLPTQREFQITPCWSETRPYRRDLDRQPNLNKKPNTL